MDWADLPETIDAWTAKLAAPAVTIRQAAAGRPTTAHVGYYLHPDTEAVGLFGPAASAADFAACKLASGPATELCLADLTAPWVKVAYSPTLRRAGELLNFFPGQYPGGIPNAPSPLAALLTSGLLGAGLGYGGGKLLSKVLPRKYGDNLGRTGAILGGLLGAAPGAVWGGVNLANQHGVTDPWPLHQQPTDTPDEYPVSRNGTNAPLPGAGDDNGWLNEYLEKAHMGFGAAPHYKQSMDAIELNEDCKAAIKAAAETFRSPAETIRLFHETIKAASETYGDVPDPRQPMFADVDINALGQTLWRLSAPPDLAATTMGAMYAAQQLPDPHARSGVATGRQLGELARSLAGDYITGHLVGAALNTVIGTPYPASTFGMAGGALGLIQAVVPRLFGG
jgi:hypothetical protein